MTRAQAIGVAVTGRGWTTALGSDIDTTWEALCRGESAIEACSQFDVSTFRNGAGGEIRSVSEADPERRLIAFLKDSFRAAVADAGLDLSTFGTRPRAEIVVGASFATIFHNEEGSVALDRPVRQALSELGVDLPLTVVSAACSSSSEALAIAHDLIAQGDADIVVAGGADVLDIYKFSGHSSLSTLSPSQCRPFDAAADGTLMGEGAAFVVLESLAHARARGRDTAIRLAGAAASTDTNTLTSPDEGGAGARRVLLQALARAGRDVTDVAYINAHGSGTPVNDAMEAQVYSDLFAAHRTPISSTKSAFGHTLGATGAVEAIVAMEALRRGEAPPTAGTLNPSESWTGGGLITGAGRRIEKGDAALSVTYGFGGANVALAFTLQRDAL